MGLWSAARDALPETRRKRDRKYKTVNALDVLPKSVDHGVKEATKEITEAESEA